MLSQLSELFAKVRQERSISIKELYDLSGVSTAVISDFENKKYLPKTDAILRMSIVLDIPLKDVLSAMLPPDEVLQKDSNSTANLDFVLTSLGFDDKEKEIITSYIMSTLLLKKHPTLRALILSDNSYNKQKGIKSYLEKYGMTKDLPRNWNPYSNNYSSSDNF